MIKTSCLASLSLCFLTFNSYAKPELSYVEELSINVNGTSSIFLDTGAGSLNIRGDDVDEINVYAKVRSSDYKTMEDLKEAFENKMELNLTQVREKVILKSLNKKSIFSFSKHNISIDLEVVIPNYLKVEIDDGSGSITISNINNSIEVDDGSGSIGISNIIGEVTIDDGSGTVNISSVEGNIYVDDGSGTININNIVGDVTVDDGSGSIIIDGLQGEFHMIDDGSGSVVINGKKWND